MRSSATARRRPPIRHPALRALARRAALAAAAALLAALPARAAEAPPTQERAPAAAQDAGPAAAPQGAPPPRARPAPANAANVAPDFAPPAQALRPEQMNAFEQWHYFERLRAVARAFEAGDDAATLRILEAMLARYPRMQALHRSRAMLLAARGDAEGALQSLAAAARLGLRGRETIEGWPPFAALARDARMAPILALLDSPPPPEALRAPPPPVAARPEGQELRLDAANAAYDREAHLVRYALALPPPPPPRAPAMIVRGDPQGAAARTARLVNRLFAEGRAAGNAGDLYDNLDRDHSRLPLDMFPQLTRTRYGPAARAAMFDYSPRKPADFGAPTIGNSSTARTSGAFWRSMPRLAMTEPEGAARAAQAYESNQLYVHPEHRDHDPFWGDVFPANTPHMLISQGSSGSDRPLLRALAAALAALRPETKALARREGLIGPTLQLLIRWGQNHVSTIDDYLSGRAHPTVFEGDSLNLLKIAGRAQAIAMDALPPLTRLRVERESAPAPGVELFGDGLSERLFDTPSAIARIFRGTARERRMIVSAADTRDPNGRKLRFKWVLLRGDPDKVRIVPLDPDGTRAEIVVAWHERVPPPGRPDMDGQRVDIGVFADNGAMHGAPSFISIAFPPRQKRVYAEDGRILSVEYDADELAERYADPMLHPLRAWRDDYVYDQRGRPLGWRRSFADGRVQDYTRHGALIEARDALGRPVRARVMRYPAGPRDKRSGMRAIAPVPSEAELIYAYDGPDDRYGYADPAPAGAGEPAAGARE
ncbi:tetratricopeptide repeat protein [Oceanicella actignis]|uniref:Uncharacterized protein n=1 Tax=Oceanicella actignis TaxID=1189325 RepID=A0A1M7S0K6_9RHOB|nr:tetratricopeptide repeat protein [Oceanicella actignis]SES93517.1 hypothetical protein SAMN04488119_102133 [Oceanicella actignis]SHN51988.1 hypothetical protein SAMN05216200_101385 [Oceanicella actignis]